MAALNQLQTFAQNTGYSIGELARAYAPVIGGGVSEQLLKNLEALGTAPFMKSSMISSSGSGTSTADDQVLQGMLNIYQSTGVIPPMGLSASGLRTKFYAAIGADGANFVAGANANKIMLSGINKAYATQSNQYSATQTSLGTLDKQLSLAKTYSDKVDRSGSPVFNKYQLYLKGSVAGDPDTKAFENIVKTASTEFAKILAGASASVAGVTVSSASDAEHLLNSSLTQAQFDEVIQVMRTEGQYRLDAQKESMSTLVGDAKKLQSTGMDTLPPDEQTKINMQSEMITTFGQGTYDQLKKDNPGVSDDELYKELKAAGKL